MQVDYVDIGNRIHEERKNKHITQEKLAEMCNISVPHMSNIENARTKVSLPVLISIANALECDIDTLVSASVKNNNASVNRIISNILDECTNEQKVVIIDTITSLKKSLKKYEEK